MYAAGEREREGGRGAGEGDTECYKHTDTHGDSKIKTRSTRETRKRQKDHTGWRMSFFQPRGGRPLAGYFLSC